MTRKKRGLWTFLFSLLPGAGEMYLGFMKQGVSLMCIFLGWFAFCAWSGFEVGLFVLPVIWFYSFFHVHNLVSLPDEEFYQQEDYYMLLQLDKIVSFDKWERGKVKFIAAVLIFIGGYTILTTLWESFWGIMPGWLYDQLSVVRNGVPRIVISLILIAFGIYLIRGKKKKLEEEPEVVYDIPVTPAKEQEGCDDVKEQPAQEVIILGSATDGKEEKSL